MSLLTSEDRLLALDHAMGMIFDGTAWDLSSLSSFPLKMDPAPP